MTINNGDEQVINVSGLTKKFGEKTVVNNLSFHIDKGCIYGLLGPNGAGKTTTFRMLTTLLKPDSGMVEINHKEIRRKSSDIKRMIGMVSQHFSMHSDLSVWEILELHGKLHSIKKEERHKRIKELLKFADLSEDKDKIAKKLSGGMKRKVMIIRAILHQPDILFLDEPTVGLDPLSRKNIWFLLEQLKESGMTIILTTHYIEEAEKLCDRVLLINKGKILMEGVPKELILNAGEYTVEVFDRAEPEYHFFSSRKDALEFSSNIESKYIVRESNLEDVFIQMNKEGEKYGF
ncbi:ABC transporter ATP-binding protein [Alkaliphilus oremlandii]|uniref:ABC transporter ATP-binding protein n=1 Tax=Alkaliphilus oremlandii TaxID=461876 RepID=UPI0018DDD79F|nr:ABC transporter ATP-binding protein [Alkaliphilus oremlandii]